MLGSEDGCKLYSGVCGDRRCHSVLYFSSESTSVDCLQCGQQHNVSTIQNVEECADFELGVKTFVRNVLVANLLPRRGPEMIKVLGLSNYFCKLLSPLLTRYGMDKATGRAKLLTEMNQGDIFDCSVFGDRAFMIDSEHISIPGFGRDLTGSMYYLSDTLELIKLHNEDEERLMPVHSDGDGHCLVHAISRALVGRELFWHPLRCCLKKHFEENLEKYQEFFKDYEEETAWKAIIAECDPDFQPPDGEFHGLRNIHVFGLANILKRPIILLDSLSCMNKCGDYAAVFIPGFVSPDECKGKDGALNKPLCVAWSNGSHNHFIPLVGIKRRALPVLPNSLLPKVWGFPQRDIFLYVEFDEKDNCTIGGNRSLSDAYILRLVSSMESLFFDLNGVHPSLVADAQLYLFPNNGINVHKVTEVIERTKRAVHEGRLYRCLSCNVLCELSIQHNWLCSGGVLYNTALQMHKKLDSDTLYSFTHGISCKYDAVRDELKPVTGLKFCTWCRSCQLRKVKSDGSLMGKVDDKPEIRSFDSTFKKEYNCFPQDSSSSSKTISIKVHWNDDIIQDTVTWQESQGSSVTDIVYQLARGFVKKHFPGEVYNDKLQCSVSEQILNQIRKSSTAMSTTSASHTETSSESDKAKHSTVEVMDEAPTPGVPVSAIPLPPPSIGYVKVVTTDGRQANLTLSKEGICYSRLQKWIENEFHIPPRKQKIKFGFPPKVFTCAANEMVPIQNGDKLLVEISKDNIKEEEEADGMFFMSEKEQNHLSELHFDLSWIIAQRSPHEFQKNGKYYLEVSDRGGLNAMKHTRLQSFPNKVFCYDEETDSIQLCMEQLGHFPIDKDMDEMIKLVQRGLPFVGVSRCPALKKRERYHFSKYAMADSDSLPPKSLLRKGPGFSILSSPSPENGDHL